MITKVLYITITLLITISSMCIGVSLEQYSRDEDDKRNAKFIGILFIFNIVMILTCVMFV